MLKLKLQYLGHLMRRTDSLEKTLVLGKIEGKRRGKQRTRWLDGINNSMEMSLRKLQEMELNSLPLECGLNLVQFSSVAQSCLTLCDPTDCSTPGFPVHHQLPELTQIHVHWVGDAIKPSHPLSSPSPPALSLSQHQGLFQRDSVIFQWDSEISNEDSVQTKINNKVNKIIKQIKSCFLL